MKAPKKIKVTASHPADGQCGIREIIGQQFAVRSYDKEDDTVTVDSDAYNGLIVLQPTEYEVIQ